MITEAVIFISGKICLSRSLTHHPELDAVKLQGDILSLGGEVISRSRRETDPLSFRDCLVARKWAEVRK